VSPASTVDVVIPVYNAPDLTRRCITSLYAYASPRLGKVVAWDNASSPETRQMLDELDFPGLLVHHAPKNLGFGGAANQGIEATGSDEVLVLNSDTAAQDDFLSPLCAALERDPRLAVATAVDRKVVQEARKSFGSVPVIPTFTFSGFAFLIRRNAFRDAGGFDPVFGLGYYEDADLSRKLLALGWRLAAVPSSVLEHQNHGSFRSLSGAKALRVRNRAIYTERYPTALRRVLLVSGATGAAVPSVRDAAEELLAGGGSLRWLGDPPVADVPAFEIDLQPYSFGRALLLLSRKRSREPRRYTELWLAGRSPVTRKLLSFFARCLGISTRVFGTHPAV
jgi:GT2 family glycosyltransferase